VVSGAVKLIAPGLDKLFKMFSGTALKMFANCALPIEITTSTNENVAADFLSKALSKVTQQRLKQGAKRQMHSASTTATEEPPGPAYRPGNTHQQIAALSRFLQCGQGAGRWLVTYGGAPRPFRSSATKMLTRRLRLMGPTSHRVVPGQN
jgi:hypothetical protein